MESILRKTIIRLDDDVELHFSKVTKYNKLGCKAIFEDPFTKKIYDIMVLSKGLLQLNSYREQLENNIRRFKSMNSKSLCQIYSYTEDGDVLYIVCESEKYKLSDLVSKREGLTEFEAIYFSLSMMEILTYLKSRNCLYQIIEFDEIYLSNLMRVSIPFSLWITYFDQGKYVPFRHQDRNSSICPEILSNSKSMTSIEDINSWNIGAFIY